MTPDPTREELRTVALASLDCDDPESPRKALARAYLAREAECEQLARERDRYDDEAAEEIAKLKQKTERADGLWLTIDQRDYRVTIEPGFPRADVTACIKLTKVPVNDEPEGAAVYHVTQFTGRYLECDCPSFIYGNRDEPDARKHSCKHCRACIAARLIAPVAMESPS